MDPEELQQIREAMPDIGTVLSFGTVEGTEVSAPETMVYVEGDDGGFRFSIDAVRAEDMAELFNRLADELAVEE